jgi:L-seryl-tRNA(Ser) seleniumtransferase
MADALQAIPAVGTLLNRPELAAMIGVHGRDLVTYALRRATTEARATVVGSAAQPDIDRIIARAVEIGRAVIEPSLQPVVNATGVILHSNLGRAVLGPRLLEDLKPIVCGYSNLEFDLARGVRGCRTDHVSEILRFLTGAEDVVVVNNNAAALVLILGTLARRRQVILSRGELIEIGDSFRLPDVMKTSGARLLEVGATNRTRLEDYREAITPQTAMLMKAHRSNFTISGFCEEVPVRELAALAHAQNLPMVYDIGSGLLRKPEGVALSAEPDVRGAIRDGADLVCFSGDKLLGGPQAGIIAGRAELIRKLVRAPLMRALRVGKLTLAALGSACRSYLSHARLVAENPTFAMMERSAAELERLALGLAVAMQAAGLAVQVVRSDGQAGGGALPDVALPGLAVALMPPPGAGQRFGQTVYRRLLRQSTPIVGVLRQGQLLFDVRTMAEGSFVEVARVVATVVKEKAR